MIATSKSRRQVLRNSPLETIPLTLSLSKPVSTQDVYLEQGMIYAVFPNNADGSVQIQYGVFQHSKVCLTVHDMQGALVAVLDERELSPQQYTADWKTPVDLAAGLYWVSLKVNGAQVHYQKLVKQ